LEHSIISQKYNKLINIEVSRGSVRQHILGVVGNIIYSFVGNLTDFLAVKELWKSVKIWWN